MIRLNDLSGILSKQFCKSPLIMLSTSKDFLKSCSLFISDSSSFNSLSEIVKVLFLAALSLVFFELFILFDILKPFSGAATYRTNGLYRVLKKRRHCLIHASEALRLPATVDKPPSTPNVDVRRPIRFCCFLEISQVSEAVPNK